MTDVVLDASVVLKWFRFAGERHGEAARALRTAYETGEVAVIAPTLLHLEILNVAGRRWQWGRNALAELAEALDGLGFELVEPSLATVASWTAVGLTAYDAAYVAVAQAAAVPLVTDDDLIVELAGSLAASLGDWLPPAG